MNCGDAYLISKVELSRAFKTVLFNEELEDIQLLYKILELTLQVIYNSSIVDHNGLHAYKKVLLHIFG